VWGDRSDEEAGNWERLYYPQFKCLPRGGIDNAWVSLPAVVPAGTEVWLQHSKKDGTALGEWVGPFAVVDLGPWYDGTDGKTKRPEWFDPYWITNTRPKVETEELDPRGRKDNGAGIDLTPATMALVKSGDAESIWERPTSAYVNVRVIEPANSENSGLISPHFSWTEFTFSDTANRLGINNTITESAKENVKDLVKYLLEPLRSWVRGPITLSSGYRSEELDAAIHEANGTAQSKDKEHTQGYACDIVFGKDKTLIEIFDYIKTNLEFDRIIWEDSHIHISFKKAKNRKLVVRSP
jgi:hypothetical protein